MSSEQRRPLVAFCAVALVCAAIMVSALRSEAVRGFLTTSIESVQEVASGREIAPRPPVKAAPVPRPEPAPASPVAEVARPVISAPARSTSRPDRGRGAKPGKSHGHRAPGDRGRGSHDGDDGDRDKGEGRGHGSKHGDRDKGDKRDKGHGHGSKHGDRDKGDKRDKGHGHGSKHGDRDKGDKRDKGKGHRYHR